MLTAQCVVRKRVSMADENNPTYSSRCCDPPHRFLTFRSRTARAVFCEVGGFAHLIGELAAMDGWFDAIGGDGDEARQAGQLAVLKV